MLQEGNIRYANAFYIALRNVINCTPAITLRLAQRSVATILSTTSVQAHEPMQMYVNIQLLMDFSRDEKQNRTDRYIHMECYPTNFHLRDAQLGNMEKNLVQQRVTVLILLDNSQLLVDSFECFSILTDRQRSC